MAGHSFLPLRRMRGPVDPFALRVTQVREENRRGEYVLYHARAARRTRNNLALELAHSCGLPVKVAQWLDEPHLTERTAAYIRKHADPSILFEPDAELIDRARIVITDDFPTLPVPKHATHLFDGNGILPMRAMEKEQYSARFFRDRAFRLFEQFWRPSPSSIDVSFLDGYAANHSKSPHHVSGLSAAIHFGHIGVHELVSAVLESGADEEDIEAFLEQLVIRRELSFNLCHYNNRYDSLEALPQWARATLDKHRRDRRSPHYSFEQFERAETHDEVWNLAQRQLLVTGTMHGYLRMLWGKKIIEWSATPEEAHRTMIRLHDVYALDGRDPNTHAGVLWCFGKHDRPWAPERPIFGTIRWMSSAQTAKKVRLKEIEELIRICSSVRDVPLH